ncbi:adenosylcobinamide-phosphate synthase [Paucibacter oligotrophus]|uniref:Cobalamin biosynthesis protein CobD n=1 Tax=Roseateles oligotrophus TaxID=1769250 RepID=A0A840LKI3_9BURK|nr:adenosylcobinamide-phosphate synthase CbiB [Roseateles oligotrophus]MBB4845787.1 adenosylcobinamide-phosphate synthase [Roseateles oligotrophus]
MALLWPLAFAFALLIDRLCGEPPTWAHPVVAMGRYLGLFSKRLLGLAPRPAFALGALAWVLGALLVGGLALLLESLLILGLAPWSAWPRLLLCAALLGLLLKPLLAWRMLADEVLAVEQALQESLEAGRLQLARLVSRDTSGLSAEQVREAAIETLAENLNDSVVAPLFWAMLAGLPGAAIYRFANTADAMWGYRGEWEWAGKWAARADDVLSWIPARITGLAMASWRLDALLRLCIEALRTPSPNSGWPMAAMALRLGLRLGKPGVYQLNATGRAPLPQDLPAALAIARRGLLGSAFVLAALAGWLRLQP